MSEGPGPPRFHVLSVWHDPPSPEMGRHIELATTRPPLDPGPSVPPALAVASVAPQESRMERVRVPSPSPVSPPARAQGLYDLPALLTRIWTAPRYHSAAIGAPSASESSGGPSDWPGAPVRSRLVPDAYSPYQIPERPAFLSPEAYASPLPRRSRPWICPNCRLPNAPWSKSCTSCRAAAP